MNGAETLQICSHAVIDTFACPVGGGRTFDLRFSSYQTPTAPQADKTGRYTEQSSALETSVSFPQHDEG